MLDHFTQYVGSCPEQSPAVLCGIAHMQTQEGIWYPRAARARCPRHCRSSAGNWASSTARATGIARILMDESGHRVRGVETDSGEIVPLAAVVSNADSVRTHRELLAETAPRIARRFERRRRYEPACSGVVLYLGLNNAYDHLLHHDFVFSRDPHEEFDFIYRKGEPAPDPTCYLASTARTEPETAPPGGDALYVLGSHALPAAAPRLEEDAPGVSPHHPRQAQDDREDAGHREPHRLSNRP